MGVMIFSSFHRATVINPSSGFGFVRIKIIFGEPSFTVDRYQLIAGQECINRFGLSLSLTSLTSCCLFSS